ncbi:MAG TPA: response regulator, partial [Anaerolineae bacterium]|nr:response regulator [Anaerolineae bacterium]
ELAGPTEEFIEQIKQALEHLYDLRFLERHPLAPAAAATIGGSTETPGQRLRRDLIAAIEALSPGSNVPFRSPHARLYYLLYVHYVEGMTIQEAAHELAISPRQAYRDLRRGQESVAAVLWARYAQPVPSEPRAFDLSSVEAEMERLRTRAEANDLCALLCHALDAVQQLAAQQSSSLQVQMPSEPIVVTVDPLVARQVLVSILSHAIQQAQTGPVTILLESELQQATLAVRYRETSESVAALESEILMELLRRLGWRIVQEEAAEGSVRSVTLQIPLRSPTILVIDDNEGLVDLLERYLTGHACRVVAADNGREGLQLAQQLGPDAVVLPHLGKGFSTIIGMTDGKVPLTCL